MASEVTTQSQRLINASASKLRHSPTLEINEMVDSHRAAGRNVVQLSFGEATLPIHADMLAALEQESRVSKYLPVAGLPELRKESQPRSCGHANDSK
jgi:aspartate/methionine/tyrosine aminotransferase